MWFYKREVDRYGVDNVALLTPFRKKSKTGVYSLNAALHDTINPASPEKDEIETGQRVLRVGDKVMQMKNRDFASNGDIGYICTSKRMTESSPMRMRSRFARWNWHMLLQYINLRAPSMMLC